MLSLAEVILAASAGFVLYVLFGYPLLLWLVARKKARPVAACLEPRTVTVLLPVYNGERWIRDKLLSILNLDYPRRLMEILVISDGSTDRTDEIARSFAVHGVRLLRVERSGKAGALNAGIQAARGEILFFTDVRQELAPDCL
jgi:biofilm PGA synthesis N-glycosyltransferase PgaC